MAMSGCPRSRSTTRPVVVAACAGATASATASAVSNMVLVSMSPRTPDAHRYSASTCDHRVMADDERDPKSFEETIREIADEVRRSVERAANTDPEEMARAAGVDPDRVREWVDLAGEWLRSQLDSMPRSEPATPAGEDVFSDADPHPLDMPTAQ